MEECTELLLSLCIRTAEQKKISRHQRRLKWLLELSNTQANYGIKKIIIELETFHSRSGVSLDQAVSLDISVCVCMFV